MEGRRPVPFLIMKNTKNVKDNIWIGPTGPNLLKENPKTYHCLHYYIKNNLPKPTDGLCEACHLNPAKQLSNKDGQYSGDISTWEWSCGSCNHLQEHTRKRWENILISTNYRHRLSTALKSKPKSLEHCQKMSSALTGRKRAPFSVETRQKMSEAFIGKPKSLEHRINLSKSKKFYYQNKRISITQ